MQELNQNTPKHLSVNTAHDKALYSLLMGYSSVGEPEKITDFNLNPNNLKEALNVIHSKSNIDSILFIYGPQKETIVSFFKLKFSTFIIQVITHEHYLEVQLNRLVDVEYHLRSLTELDGMIYHLGSHELSALHQMRYYRYASSSLMNLYFLLKEIPTLTIQEVSFVALIESLSIEHQNACLNHLNSKLIRTTLSELTYESEFYNENAFVFNTFKKILENSSGRSVWNLGYKVARLIGV